MRERTFWIDHIRAEDGKLYKILHLDGTTYAVTPEGEILQQGTPQDAAHFNSIEESLMANEESLLILLNALRQAKDKTIVSGSISDGVLTFVTEDGSSVVIDGRVTGRGIASASIRNDDGHLLITYDDDEDDPTVEDVGKVVGEDGDDGNGISSIELLSTSGLIKTYRINFTNGGHYDFAVTDGADGQNGIIQGVKVNGTALTPDANGVVDIVQATWKKIKFSDLSWSYDSSGGSGTFGAQNSALYDRRAVPNTIISSKYKSTTRTGSGSGWYIGYYGVGQGIYVRDTTYGTDADAFLSAHGDDYFYYLE